MKDSELNETLRKLPAVHELVEQITGEDHTWTPTTVLMACRSVLENERAFILEGKKPETSEKLRDKVLIELDRITRSSMKNVINATGIILHTAIGRACMPDSAVEAVSRIARGYSVLQWDCETGRRGHRDIHTERLIRELAGSEAATIANNNAGATLLVLSALASGREVIVS
ncbi:MAG: L-seryl-tRNA(Sec) selenium transferase, partial [Candidatus Aegiribacteria sp.]|nr:L-seryl-tRNA(Sec) selenium transferase [Candidatus Aegiribacteria sp.]